MQLQAAYFPGRDTAPTFSDEAPYQDAVLTDEHDMCSCGQPVILLGGVPHVPGALRGVLMVRPQTVPVSQEAYETSEVAARTPDRHTPESIALIEAAKAAGYHIGQ